MKSEIKTETKVQGVMKSIVSGWHLQSEAGAGPIKPHLKLEHTVRDYTVLLEGQSHLHKFARITYTGHLGVWMAAVNRKTWSVGKPYQVS